MIREMSYIVISRVLDNHSGDQFLLNPVRRSKDETLLDCRVILENVLKLGWGNVIVFPPETNIH